jgi:hypothetical protein
VTKTMLDAPVALGVGSWGWRAEVAGQTGCKTFPVRTVVLAVGARCGAAPRGAADEVRILGALHGPAFHLDVFSWDPASGSLGEMTHATLRRC